MSLAIERVEAPREAIPLGHEPKHEPRGGDQAAENPRRHLKSKTARDGFAACLVLITLAAVYGQIGYGIVHYTPGALLEYLPAGTAHLVARLVIAVAVAVAIESIANLVQFKAHEARLAKDAPGAAKLSRVAYGIAAGVAFINYQHFCDPGLRPTPTALVFAGFSFISPWLWGIYTRGVEHKQRVADGTADQAGAVFAVQRYRNFPIHTWRARRYSIMHNITDPAEAWNAYMAEYRRGVTTHAIERRQRRETAPSTRWLGRWGGAIRGENGGETTPARGGATRGETSGVTGGVKPGEAATTPPGGRPTVASLVRPTSLTSDERTALSDAAVDWAAAQTVKTGQPVGWRSIIAAADDRTGAPLFPGLTEHAARQAARWAKDRLDGVHAGGAR